jgi:hypothetical protein
MKSTVAILTRWRREDPDRLLACALRQARELAEVVPELDGLRSQNAALAQQLEIQTKRIAQLEEALQAAERAAHRQAAPFRIEEKKRVLAPKPPGRKHGHPGAFRHRPDHIDEYIEVELCACPHCGARDFIDQSQIEQYRRHSAGASSRDTPNYLRGDLCPVWSACPFQPSSANVASHWRRQRPARTPCPGLGG